MALNLSGSRCAGAIINDRYILTAAHCLKKQPNTTDITAVIGVHHVHERRYPGDIQEVLEVESYLQHEQYNPSVRMHDIALVKLKEPLDMDKWTPICLMKKGQDRNLDNLFVAGWGINKPFDPYAAKPVHKRPTELQEVEVDEVDDTTCAKYRNGNFDSDKLLCAGSENGVCKGDSGGPLCTRRGGLVYAVGIVSFGKKGCGYYGKIPDFYTRISGYFDWIDHHTSDAVWCGGPN